MAITYIALVCLVLATVILRVRVPQWSPARRRQLFVLLALLLLPSLLNTITRWETASLHLNAFLFWTRLFAYELCVVSFTLITPRLLTTAIAVILTLPLFSSSASGPASALFMNTQTSLHPVGDGYFLELLPWSSGPGQNGGADFSLFYQPPGMHLLRRPFVGARLYDTQCRTSTTTATVHPATAHITLHCPPLSTDPAAPPSGTDFDFLIPRGARSPALARVVSR